MSSPPDAAGAPEGAPTKDTPASDSAPDSSRVRLLVAHALEQLDEQPRLARVELEECLRLLDRGGVKKLTPPGQWPTSLPFDVHVSDTADKLEETIGRDAAFNWSVRLAGVLAP